MKIRLVNWLNLVVACIDFIAAIIGFCIGNPINIIVACFCLVAGAWNAFVFLHAVSVRWEKSEKIQQKFKFRCKYCGYYNIPSFWRWLFVPHIASKRYLRCEACGDKHFMRRK